MLDQVILLGLLISIFLGPVFFEVCVGFWGAINLFKGKLRLGEIFGSAPPFAVLKHCIVFGVLAAVGIAGFEFIFVGAAMWIRPSLSNAIMTASRHEGITYLYLLIIGPMVEEFLLRGILLTLISRRFGIIAGLFGSSFFFGFLHGEPIGHTLLGLLLGLMYISTSNLWTPLILHILNNAMAIGLEALTQHFGWRILDAQAASSGRESVIFGLCLAAIGLPFFYLLFSTHLYQIDKRRASHQPPQQRPDRH